MLLLLWVTNGPINVYEQYLFSVHMLGHMLLGMAIPVLLVLAAPITLALRAVHKRDDGSRGVREWILLAVHSKVAAVRHASARRGGLFAASLWVFYYSPIFRWATEDHIGHTWMVVHFLITGYLFAQTLVGIDPIPNRPPYPAAAAPAARDHGDARVLRALAGHRHRRCCCPTGTARWGAPGGSTPLADQQAGGGIAWSVGEIPTVILAILVAVHVEPQRRPRRQAAGPRGRPRRRRRAQGVQRDAARSRQTAWLRRSRRSTTAMLSSATVDRVARLERHVLVERADAAVEERLSPRPSRCAVPGAGPAIQVPNGPGLRSGTRARATIVHSGSDAMRLAMLWPYGQPVGNSTCCSPQSSSARATTRPRVGANAGAGSTSTVASMVAPTSSATTVTVVGLAGTRCRGPARRCRARSTAMSVLPALSRPVVAVDAVRGEPRVVLHVEREHRDRALGEAPLGEQAEPRADPFHLEVGGAVAAGRAPGNVMR